MEISKIAMLCSLMQNILKSPRLWTTKEEPEFKKIIIESFVFAYIWSIGGNLIENSREPFDNFIRSQFEKVKDTK